MAAILPFHQTAQDEISPVSGPWADGLRKLKKACADRFNAPTRPKLDRSRLAGSAPPGPGSTENNEGASSDLDMLDRMAVLEDELEQLDDQIQPLEELIGNDKSDATRWPRAPYLATIGGALMLYGIVNIAEIQNVAQSQGPDLISWLGTALAATALTLAGDRLGRCLRRRPSRHRFDTGRMVEITVASLIAAGLFASVWLQLETSALSWKIMAVPAMAATILAGHRRQHPDPEYQRLKHELAALQDRQSHAERAHRQCVDQLRQRLDQAMAAFHEKQS